MNLDLPFPPSTNTYWRHVPQGKRVRVLISASGRNYRLAVARHVLVQKAALGLSEALCVVVRLRPPDNRRRDLDNYAGKALFDALQHAGVYLDDSQIKESHNYMLAPQPGGRCIVTITELDYVDEPF